MGRCSCDRLNYMPLTLVLNGQSRTFETLANGSSLQQLVEALELKSDQIAVERNGEIAPRTNWPAIGVAAGDRIEVVHFVGGGLLSALSD
jgi:sulfur carrier protein